MSKPRDLMRRFVEDRESLSNEEMEALIAALRSQPELALELKDQLVVDELLAQWRDLTRWHFLRQVDQRLRDQATEEGTGFVGLLPGTFEQLADCDRKPGVEDPPNPLADDAGTGVRRTFTLPHGPAIEAPARGRGWRWLTVVAAAALVLISVWKLGPPGLVPQESAAFATLETVAGTVQLTRAGIEQAGRDALAIREGDGLSTSDGASAVVRYPDGTTLRLGAQTVVSIATDHQGQGGKRVRIDEGRLTADVAHQPPGRPLVFETPTARAEVLGTALELLVRPEETHLTVTEGRVRLQRNGDPHAVVVARNEFAVAGRSSLAAAPLAWPSNRDGLIFLLETNERPNLVHSITSGINRSYTVRPRGRAHLNHDYALVFHGGAFLAEDVDGEILDACRRTNELTIEAEIRPALATQTGPARIVTFSTDVNQRDFTLGQDGDKLIVRIRTPQTGPNGVVGSTGVAVCTLAAGESNHVVVSYKPGSLVCYLNGRRVFQTDQVRGDFRDWSAQHLLFGDEYGGERSWRGILEGVAIFNRVLEPAEVERDTLEYRHLMSERPVVPQVRAAVTLLAKSTLPTAAAIRPDRSALVVCKYRVNRGLQGTLDESEIYVAQWALLDAEAQPIAEQAPGTESELVLEPLERNPQLSPYRCRDDFGHLDEKKKPRYYAVPTPDQNDQGKKGRQPR